MKNVKELLGIEDPVRRRAVFAALFSRAVLEKGAPAPIVVGGEAVEIYTQGGYSTGDIDIVCERGAAETVLKGWGFERAGRLWINKDLDIYIDWRGGALEGGKEPETIRVADDLSVRLISIEDLIIDRLCAAKWWGDKDGVIWAKVLIGIKKAIGGLDEGYLWERAEKEKISDVLDEALRGAPSGGGETDDNNV